MMLGTDVSGLSTTAANAAAQGLSIVVPVYNEAAGLAALHARLGALAKTLRERYGLGSEVVYVDDGSSDDTLAIARGLAADALDVQVVSLSRNFGKEAALTATASIRPISSSGWSLTGSMRATTWSIPRKPIATMNRSCGGSRCTVSTR
jgi:cellulose synthase/poly-beta-1,6-N-acetylglucosamine synthase-like glycosyltransferase